MALWSYIELYRALRTYSPVQLKLRRASRWCSLRGRASRTRRSGRLFRVVATASAWAIDIGAAAYNTLGSTRVSVQERRGDVLPTTIVSREAIKWCLN
jgi:hypothetical protein